MQQVETLQKTKTNFSLLEATNANAYASLETWQNFCQKQKKLGFEPSPPALKLAQKKHWWKKPEITAKAAGIQIVPINKNPFQIIWGIFIFC